MPALHSSKILIIKMDSSSSSSSSSAEVIEDCFGVLKVYSDGTIFRATNTKHQVKTHDDGSAVWDCCFDTKNNLKQRLYIPKNHFSSSNKNNHKKLPIVYYLHAGGFCFTSRNAHNTCLSLCSGLQALIICPYYRLAPEHRLPAALEDAIGALKFLRSQALMSESCEPDPEKWLFDGVDLDRVFVLGDSCGGNIAHHLAIQLGPGSPELRPIRIRGYILLSPFFGGVIRTKSEEESPKEDFWSQEIYDQFWRLAMPNGADRDHPLVNPFGPESPSLEGVSLDPILVLVGGDEILKDRVEDYAKRMKLFNNNVNYVEFKGKQHGFFTSYSYLEESQDVIQLVKNFISENSK